MIVHTIQTLMKTAQLKTKTEMAIGRDTCKFCNKHNQTYEK